MFTESSLSEGVVKENNLLDCIVAMHVIAVSHNRLDSSNHAVANNLECCTDTSNFMHHAGRVDCS